jgi:hypothetical protein
MVRPTVRPASWLVLGAVLLLNFGDYAWAARPATSKSPARPARSTFNDYQQRIDVNDLSMFVTNVGSFAYNVPFVSPGLEFPRGSGKTAVFAGGLWLGALVNGLPRVAVAEYNGEYGPGAMAGGAPLDPYDARFHVYKLLREYPDNASREAALADYEAGAVPFGAPSVTRVGSTGLNIVGHQFLWSVYNDADVNNHISDPGHTLPLGVDVRESVWAFADTGPLGRTIFIRHHITNAGTNTLEDLRIGLWSDPDVGGAMDDKAGCVPAAGLGYVYNANDADAIYGSSPPAIGFDLLAGPTPPGGGPASGMQAFTVYVNGTDPASSDQTWARLRGLNANGSFIIDPSTGYPTPFMYPGDPIGLVPWIDGTAADKRIMPASGPVTLLPGQSTEVTWAIIVGQEGSHLHSLARLQCDDQTVQATYDAGFTQPFPPRMACGGPVSCVRPLDYWADQCPAGSDYTAVQMDTIASRVDQQSMYFDLSGTGLAGLCAVFQGTSPRDMAEQEYAALLCNVTAGSPPLVPQSGEPVRLDPTTPIACEGLTATTVGELTSPAVYGLEADYRNLVVTFPTPIMGVDAGLPAFGGGAGTGADFLGSTISPELHPDSMVHVELRFDAGQPQKAYRFLRFEMADGSLPYEYPGGRGYVFAGMHDVPFTVWDVDHNVQLDVAFIERTITDEYGTIQPAGVQPATLDSTWSPDNSASGGREYLFVFSRPYSPTAKPELAQDGALLEATLPVLYGLWARRISAGAVFDPGDRFDFRFGYVGPSVDAMMMRLAGMPPAEANPYYAQIAACLSDINHGIGIGPTCDAPTAVLVSLVRADATIDGVTLVWSVSEPLVAAIERQVDGGVWTEVARRNPDGNGWITFEDHDVTAGARQGYRLRVQDGDVLRTLGETSVDIPRSAALALRGFVPNPARGPVGIAFTLTDPTAAVLSLYDVAGRRVHRLDVGSYGPGSHVVPVGRGLPSGVYLVRLEQGGRTITARSALVR